MAATLEKILISVWRQALVEPGPSRRNPERKSRYRELPRCDVRSWSGRVIKSTQFDHGILSRFCTAAANPSFHNRKHSAQQTPSTRSIYEVSHVFPINKIGEKYETRPRGQSPEFLLNNTDAPISDAKVTGL
jgi:hypothetical protein